MAQRKIADPFGADHRVAAPETPILFAGVGLMAGLFAIALVYLLLVVNFQSWTDPFIIITALPGALAGVIWMLFLSQTTLSVPSLMGAIMCLGVATANSVLIVTFARMAIDDQVRIERALVLTDLRSDERCVGKCRKPSREEGARGCH